MRAMRLKHYFAGERLRLRSSLSAHAIAERINRATGSSLWPFSTGVIGGVWRGRVRLRYRSSLFEYNAKPVLAGRLHEGPAGSILDLCYRAPVWSYSFYILWYVFLGLFMTLSLAYGWDPDLAGGEKAAAVALVLLMLIVPIAMHAIGTRNADYELERLIEFLAEHAQAKRSALAVGAAR